MTRTAAFFRWLGTPIRAGRALFPFTYDGRQTLIYLMCALSAPILSFMVIWILDVTADHRQWQEHREIARLVAYSLLISVCAFSMFVAFRSLSLGSKEGLLNINAKDSPADPVKAAVKVAEEVKHKADVAVAQVATEAAEASKPKPATNPTGDAL